MSRLNSATGCRKQCSVLRTLISALVPGEREEQRVEKRDAEGMIGLIQSVEKQLSFIQKWRVALSNCECIPSKSHL